MTPPIDTVRRSERIQKKQMNNQKDNPSVNIEKFEPVQHNQDPSSLRQSNHALTTEDIRRSDSVLSDKLTDKQSINSKVTLHRTHTVRTIKSKSSSSSEKKKLEIELYYAKTRTGTIS